jgi:hypothetical protein
MDKAQVPGNGRQCLWRVFGLQLQAGASTNPAICAFFATLFILAIDASIAYMQNALFAG